MRVQTCLAPGREDRLGGLLREHPALLEGGKKTGFGISRSLFQFLIPVDRLPAVLVGDGELLAAVTTAGGEHAAAVGGSHAGAEAVLVHALAVGGLKCSFHRIYLLYFC